MALKKSKKTSKSLRQAQPRVSAEMLPRVPIYHASEVASVLHNTYAGKYASREDLAKALGLNPNSMMFKNLISSAYAYGLINREDTDHYSLSELGRRIIAPTYHSENVEGMRRAILTPPILSKFYSDYDGHPLPSEDHFLNVLETHYGIPHNRVKEAREVILNNASYLDMLDYSKSTEQPILRLSHSTSDERGINLEQLKDGPKANEIVADLTASESVDWTKICFFITPIGDESSEVRRHADMMLKHLLDPVVTQQFGLKVIRADKIDKSGLINQQVFEHLAKAKLCVADLSFSNPNAFYELGVRHVFKLPAIQIIRKGDRIPFDVSQGRTITVDTSDIYTIMDRFESARKELAEHVKHIQSNNYQDSGQDNPINVYLPGLKTTLPK